MFFSLKKTTENGQIFNQAIIKSICCCTLKKDIGFSVLSVSTFCYFIHLMLIRTHTHTNLPVHICLRLPTHVSMSLRIRPHSFINLLTSAHSASFRTGAQEDHPRAPTPADTDSGTRTGDGRGNWWA